MRALTANLFVGNRTPDRAAARIRRTRAAIVCVQEMHGNVGFRVPGYRALINRGHQRDCSVALFVLRRPWIRVLEYGFVLATERTGPGGIGAPRWFAYAVVRVWRRRILVIGMHNPVVSRKHELDPDRGVPAQTVRLWDQVWDLAADHRGQVLLLGDLNDAPFEDRPSWSHEPTQMLPRHGYRFVRIKVDYVAARSGPVRLLEGIRPAEHGGDHHWLLASVRR